MNTHWAPDNMYIAFTEGTTDIEPHETQTAFSSNGEDDDLEFFVMNADGSGQQNFTRETNHDVGADWSN